MAADAWKKYDSFPEYMGDGTIDMDNDTFKCALLTSGYVPNTATQSVWADISANEVPAANGYVAGGYTMTVTWAHTGGTTTFDSDDPNWTAIGGSIVCRYAVIYDDTPTIPADPLVAYSLLDNTPADVTVTDGNKLTLQIDANGVFTVTGM